MVLITIDEEELANMRGRPRKIKSAQEEARPRGRPKIFKSVGEEAPRLRKTKVFKPVDEGNKNLEEGQNNESKRREYALCNLKIHFNL